MKAHTVYADEINVFDYRAFIKYALDFSDVFSLVFSDSHQLESNNYFKALELYCVKIRNNPVWPNTTVLPINGKFNSEYTVCFYKADELLCDLLLSTGGLFEMCYPDFPDDLCFYKDNKCWFATTAHEGFACLYTSESSQADKLRTFGLPFDDGEIIPDDLVFFEEYML